MVSQYKHWLYYVSCKRFCNMNYSIWWNDYAWSRILPVKLIFAQQLEDFLPFMEAESSISYLQQPTIRSYPDPDESNLCPSTLFFDDPFQYFLPHFAYICNVVFLFTFSIQTLRISYRPISFYMQMYFILYYCINFVIYYEEPYKLYSFSLSSFLQSPVTSPLLGPQHPLLEQHLKEVVCKSGASDLLFYSHSSVDSECMIPLLFTNDGVHQCCRVSFQPEPVYHSDAMRRLYANK
jgi:hypothetical protein